MNMNVFKSSRNCDTLYLCSNVENRQGASSNAMFSTAAQLSGPEHQFRAEQRLERPCRRHERDGTNQEGETVMEYH